MLCTCIVFAGWCYRAKKKKSYSYRKYVVIINQVVITSCMSTVECKYSCDARGYGVWM